MVKSLIKQNEKWVHKNKFISFSNSDGKQWSIPITNSSTGLAIYEPSGMKGKLIKKFFPYIKCFLPRISFLKCGKTNILLDDKLVQLLNGLFTENYEFSVFWGTPSTDQKITLQIFKGQEILGYCKISSSERAAKLFAHEKHVLDFLNSKKLDNIPQCLFCGKVADEYIFVQSTQKKKKYSAVQKFSILQMDFLNELKEKTGKKIEFEETDYYCNLKKTENLLFRLSLEEQKILKSAISLIYKEFSEKTVNWGVVCRDFTPWNMCVNQNQLFVFDFEYALYSGPSSNDYWHFQFQSDIYEKKMSSEQIANSVVGESYIDILLYLIDIIGLYLERGKDDDLRIVRFEIEIMKIIIERGVQY